jgi:hypothetical protein
MTTAARASTTHRGRDPDDLLPSGVVSTRGDVPPRAERPEIAPQGLDSWRLDDPTWVETGRCTANWQLPSNSPKT